MPKRLTNDEFQKRLNSLSLDVYTDDIYVSVNKSMNFYCSKNHYWNTIALNVLQKRTGCPFCSGRYAIIGETDLLTTRPDVACLLKNKDDGYALKEYSKTKVDFICPDCGAVLNKVVGDVSRDGLSCSVCGDGVSYPNKFARAMLQQLNVNSVEYEWQPEWLKPYSYDNYFVYNDMQYVLEMDGGIGHGNVTYKTQEKDVDGLIRDQYKDSHAINYNINVIRIDCNYGNSNRFDFIVNSIVNSRLSIILDLSVIDWNYCDQVARSSMICTVANMYDSGMTIKEIIESTGYGHTTIHKWLKHAASINLCTYNPNESKLRSRKLVEKLINQYDKFNVFVSTYVSQKDAEIQTGIKSSMINAVLRGRKKSAGGFIWFYSDDPGQPDKTKIISNNTKLMKEAI